MGTEIVALTRYVLGRRVEGAARGTGGLGFATFLVLLGSVLGGWGGWAGPGRGPEVYLVMSSSVYGRPAAGGKGGCLTWVLCQSGGVGRGARGNVTWWTGVSGNYILVRLDA